MKKLVLVFAAILVGLAVLLPFASTTPDGLETLTEKRANPEAPYWNGLMADYSIAISEPFMSTLVAGLLGTAVVLAASLAVGATLTHQSKTKEN